MSHFEIPPKPYKISRSSLKTKMNEKQKRQLWSLPTLCWLCVHLLLSIFSSASLSWEGDVGHQEGSQLDIQELQVHSKAGWRKCTQIRIWKKGEKKKRRKKKTLLNFDHRAFQLSAHLICNLWCVCPNSTFRITCHNGKHAHRPADFQMERFDAVCIHLNL